MKLIVYTFLVCMFFACSPKVTTQNFGNSMTNIEEPENIVVFQVDEEMPEGSKVIGTVNIDKKAYTFHCSYEEVMAIIQLEAFKMGGNAVKITSHKRPNMINSCHRMEALVLNAPLEGSLTIFKEPVN